jgi:hypothetical protein
VYTLLSKEFDDKFGFTEQELETLLRDFHLLDRYDGIQEWYNGYRFGGRVIYNEGMGSGYLFVCYVVYHGSTTACSPG